MLSNKIKKYKMNSLEYYRWVHNNRLKIRSKNEKHKKRTLNFISFVVHGLWLFPGVMQVVFATNGVTA